MEQQIKFLREQLQRILRDLSDKPQSAVVTAQKRWIYESVNFLGLSLSDYDEEVQYFYDYFSEIFHEYHENIILTKPEMEKQYTWSWVRHLCCTPEYKIYFGELITPPLNKHEENENRFVNSLSYKDRKIILYHILGIFYFSIDKNNIMIEQLSNCIKHFEKSMRVPQNKTIFSFETPDRKTKRLKPSNDHKTDFQRKNELNKGISNGFQNNETLNSFAKMLGIESMIKDVMENPNKENIANNLSKMIPELTNKCKSAVENSPFKNYIDTSQIEEASKGTATLLDALIKDENASKLFNTVTKASSEFASGKKIDSIINENKDILLESGAALKSNLESNPNLLEQLAKINLASQDSSATEILSKAETQECPPDE